jgi:riboflavin kinase/FMN adenylyltransferase
VGVRPTVDQNDTVNCETYLLDFSGDLYGKEVTVAFLEFLRPEQKFASVDALREQIEKDIIRARKYQA